MKHIKAFENYIRLNDLPYFSGEIQYKKSNLKYKIGDIVKYKDLDRHFIIKQLNLGSNNQDYYIYNPLHVNDKGWVVEEELLDPDVNSENYYDVYINKQISKYGL